MRRRPFTLIEMLVVMFIIVLMMGILLAAIAGVRKHANIVKATANLKQLESAIVAYQNTYQGVLPFTLVEGTTQGYTIQGDSSQGGTLNHDGGNTVSFPGAMQTANGWSTADRYQLLLNTLQGSDATLNPRKQKFLELDANSKYLDPWGNNFCVTLDLDYNENIPTANLAGADTPLLRSIAIWSMGRDMKHTMGGLSTSALNKDNVNSWTAR